jgi:uncharacterized repeat protein (TIGR01451 family)
MKPLFLFLPRSRLLRAALGLVAAAALFAPGTAFASTAANTTITNTATVNYKDAGGVAQAAVTATVDVTVQLVPSAVTLSSPANQTISQGTSATLTYTITSTANGADTYNLSSSVTPSANNSSVSPTIPASITLGGTTLANAANNGDVTIVVPYDGAGATVNGIAVGATIIIGGNAYLVGSITKNAGTNTTTVGITTAIAGGSVAAGQIVGERKTFTETVPSGTLSSGASGTQTVSTTATSNTLGTATTTQTTPTVITVNRPTLTVTKLVSTDGGTTFTASGVAPPGTSLIYKIVATNTGTTNAQQVAFTDVVPQFLSYVNGSGKFATSNATTYAGATALTEGSGGYSYTAGTQTVAYDPGGATGTVAGSGVLVLFFRATIN